MKAKLVGISGWDLACPIELVLPVVLGRSRSAGLMVPQSLVSRQHCELYEQDGKLMVRDLGSMNGTRVNQVRIDVSTELTAGDLLTVGAVTFRVDCEDHPATISDSRDETAVVLRSRWDRPEDRDVGEPSVHDRPTEKSNATVEAEGTPRRAVPVALDDRHPTQNLSDLSSAANADDSAGAHLRKAR